MWANIFGAYACIAVFKPCRTAKQANVILLTKADRKSVNDPGSKLPQFS